MLIISIVNNAIYTVLTKINELIIVIIAFYFYFYVVIVDNNL